MPSCPDRLLPQEFGLPDLSRAGNLVFGAFCDPEKLVDILSQGIRPRRGHPAPFSYFPDVVSLSALGAKGYPETDGIKMGWLIIIENAKRFGKIDLENSFCYSFVLDPVWIKTNINGFLGVGEALRNNRFSTIFRVGSLSNLLIGSDSSYEEAFFEEVHYKDGTIPPEALRGILIDENRAKYTMANNNVEEAIGNIDQSNRKIKLPFGIYNQSGELVKLKG